MPPPFLSVLIANRGEIAVRIARACRELDIRSIAVYSEADTRSLHVLEADAAIEIGPAEATKSYLNIKRIIDAARKSGAQAVHPGYGFLAENADFAEAVMAAGLVWVGPPLAAMRAMGDKAGARALMEKTGVPVVPGYQGKDDKELLKKAAEKIGFPLLVKAAAGGGGMGQRVVNAAGELGTAIESARREAQRAFGEGRLILEKYLPNARHIEFQVLGDRHDNLLHLFERECSLQRRRQKIVEETPSPLLDDKLRIEMGEAALAAAGAVGYTNAGTVEFLVDPETREFYFLEMNTRIQVEHPITEMVCGIDLVQWQLRIAAGEKLPFKQKDVKQRGHAIECRIYAEDAGSGFLPQAGRVFKMQVPEGDGVRLDAGVGEGSEVGVHYDPLLAKLIVHAEDRAAALAKMQVSLRETAFLGLTTNIDFLQDLLASARVQSGDYDTRFVENNMDELTADRELPVEVLLAAALVDMQPAGVMTDNEIPDPHSPWASSIGFRIGEKR